MVIQQQSKENGVGLIFMSDEYFEAERNRIVRIQNINYKLVPQTSKSFEEGFVEGQLKEKQKWINFVEAMNVVCDYPKDFQKEIIKEVKKEKKELV